MTTMADYGGDLIRLSSTKRARSFTVFLALALFSGEFYCKTLYWVSVMVWRTVPSSESGYTTRKTLAFWPGEPNTVYRIISLIRILDPGYTIRVVIIPYCTVPR